MYKPMRFKIASNRKICLINKGCETSYFREDVGHETAMTKGITYMPFLDAKLVALHLHDNMAQIGKDWHMIPARKFADMVEAYKADKNTDSK